MSDRPNILFFSIDTLRYDMVARQRERAHLAKHGVDATDVTPNLDGWVGRSTFFSAASSVSTYTTASHASLLTGLYPPRHGSRSFLKNQIYPEVRTLQEILLDEGYRTILLTDTLRFFSYTALQRGFTDVVTSDTELAGLLKTHDDRPLFILLHVFDVHMPYLYSFDPTSPDENADFFSVFDALVVKYGLRTKQPAWSSDFYTMMQRYRQIYSQFADLEDSAPMQLDLYVQGVRKFDQGRFQRLVGLLEGRKFFEHAMFAGFSDHGEGFYPHSPQLAHSGPLTEETSRIPLFIWHSGGCPSGEVPQPVSLVDLAPTALEFAGVDTATVPYAMDGSSLMGSLGGGKLGKRLLYQEIWVDGEPDRSDQRARRTEADRVARKAAAETTLHQRAVIGDRLKLMVTGRDQAEFDPRLAAAGSAEEFAERCYTDILGRVGDRAGIDAMVANIESSPDPDLARHNIVDSLLSGAELAVWGKYRLFDYRADPLGIDPVEFNPVGWRGRNHRALIERLRATSELDSLPGPPITVASADEQSELGEMLEALGYADGEASRRPNTGEMTQPNVFLLSIDTLRYDFVAAQPETQHHAALGIDRRDVMPRLDDWVGRGTFFSNATSVSTYTTSSHASVLTGRFPPGHGVRAFFKTRLRPEVQTLPEQLAAAGYRCVLHTDTPGLFRNPGLDRGFADVVTSDTELFRLLDGVHDEPLFCLLHVFDIHTPYLYSFGDTPGANNADFLAALDDLEGSLGVPATSPEPSARLRAVISAAREREDARQLQFDLYRRGAAKFDGGRLRVLSEELQSRGLLDGSLQIVFSDHGEGFYPGNPLMCHGGALTEETTRVPLFVHHPRESTRPRVDRPVSLVDVAATVLDFTGVGGEAGTQWGDGESLLPSTQGTNLPRRLLYGEVWRDDASPLGAAEHDLERWRSAAPPADALGRNSALFQRAVRGQRLRLIVTGQEPHELAAALDGTSVEEFVEQSFRGILGRSVDPESFRLAVDRLRNLGDAPEDREAHLEELRQSGEAALAPTYMLFDYRRDPRAVSPIHVGRYTWSRLQRRPLLTFLRDVSATGEPPAPPIHIESTEERRQINTMLADFGYADPDPGPEPVAG